MSYQKIDPTLEKWATKNSLKLARRYQDVEVRSVSIVSANGTKQCQIWIEPMDHGDVTAVHVWNYAKRKKDYSADLCTLMSILDRAHQQALKWNT